MASQPKNALLRHIRKLASVQAEDAISDRELLRRYVTHGDHRAFETVMRRHGPLVLGIGRRVLHHHHDAEDVFQATFVVLAAKAGSLRWRESIANWLYLVAYRLALRTRAVAARRCALERRAAVHMPDDPLNEISVREAQAVLDDELSGLPEKYRSPLLLCCFEGASRDEAAQQLGWSLSTLKRRLVRGRELLRARLGRRGLALPTVLLGTLLAEGTTPASVPELLLASTLVIASRSVTAPASLGGASASVARLARGLVKTMLLSKLKIAAGLVLLLAGISGLIVGVVRQHAVSANRTDPQQETTTPPIAALQGQTRSDFAGDPLPPGALLRLGSLRLRHKASVAGVVFVAGRKAVLTSGNEAVMRLWDPATGKELAKIEGFYGFLACSPDGNTLAGGNRTTIDIWDLRAKEFYAGLAKPVRSIHTGTFSETKVPISFSPDGKILAAVVSPQEVRLWEVATGKELTRSPAQDKKIETMGFTPDGKALMTATGSRGEECTIRWWEPATGKQIRNLRIRNHVNLRPYGFSPDGKALALEGWADAHRQEGGGITFYTEYLLHVWDLESGQERWQLDPMEEVIWSARFSPDSKKIACQRMDGSLSVWDAISGKLCFSHKGYPESSRPDGGCTLAYSADGQLLATVGSSAQVHLWDLALGQELIATPEAHHSSVTCVAYSPDGKILASGSNDHTIALWDAALGRQRGRFIGHQGGIRALAFTRDGKRLASSADDDTIRLWDPAEGKLLFTLKEQRKPRSSFRNFGVRALVFLSGDQTLVSWGEDYMLRHWDVATGKELFAKEVSLSDLPSPQTFEAPGSIFDPIQSSYIQAAAFTPDGQTAVLSSHEAIYLVNVATGQEVLKMPVARRLFQQLAVSADGQTLLSAGWDKSVRLWELATGKEVLQLTVPDRVNAVAFAPDGRSVGVATGWSQGVIHLFSAATGKEHLKLQGHGCSVPALAFSPKGKTLASGQADTTILIWDRARGGAPPSEMRDLSARELESLWADLASADASRAHVAMAVLSANPKRAMALLLDRLRPAAPTDPQRIEQLIADLNSSKFAVRENASRELKMLGEEAEPAVRRVLQKPSSAEVRRRAQALLATPPPWRIEAPESLRRIRAVQVLESIDSARAKAVLERLARGAPAARETQIAQTALDRLAERAGVVP